MSSTFSFFSASGSRLAGSEKTGPVAVCELEKRLAPTSPPCSLRISILIGALPKSEPRFKGSSGAISTSWRPMPPLLPPCEKLIVGGSERLVETLTVWPEFELPEFTLLGLASRLIPKSSPMSFRLITLPISSLNPKSGGAICRETSSIW